MSECYLSHVALGLRYRLLQFIIPEALIRYTVRLLFMKPDVLFRFSVRLIFSTPDDLNMQIECQMVVSHTWCFCQIVILCLFAACEVKNDLFR